MSNDISDVVIKVADMVGIALVSSMDKKTRPVYLVSTPNGTEVCFSVENKTNDYLDLLVNASNVPKFKRFISNLKYELAIFEGFEPEIVKEKPIISKPFEPNMLAILPTRRIIEPMVLPKNIDGDKRDLRKEINQIARVPNNLYSWQIMDLMSKIEDAKSAYDLKIINIELDETVKTNIQSRIAS